VAVPFAWLSRPSLLRTLLTRLRLAARLLREPSVPLLVKSLVLVPAFYVLFPLDVLPDVFPILGQLDDLGVVLMVVEGFLKLCPVPALEFHRQSLEAGLPFTPMRRHNSDGEVIDAEWRRE
jgi:uncharacterized membrane protein YkvA (DUF1232 family)